MPGATAASGRIAQVPHDPQAICACLIENSTAGFGQLNTACLALEQFYVEALVDPLDQDSARLLCSKSLSGPRETSSATATK
jgi:hypothetical protein